MRSSSAASARRSLIKPVSIPVLYSSLVVTVVRLMLLPQPPPLPVRVIRPSSTIFIGVAAVAAFCCACCWVIVSPPALVRVMFASRPPSTIPACSGLTGCDAGTQPLGLCHCQ